MWVHCFAAVLSWLMVAALCQKNTTRNEIEHALKAFPRLVMFCRCS